MPFIPLKDIEKKIEDKIKELELVCKFPVKNAILDHQANYVTPCHDKKGNSFIFKARIFNRRFEDEKGNPLLERNFKNELYFYQSAYNSSKKSEDLSSLVLISPHYIQGEIGDLDWLLYKKIEGKVLGDRFGPFEKEITEDHKIISMIIESIQVIQKIKPPFLNHLQKFNHHLYKKIWSKLIKRFERQTAQLPKNKVRFILERKTKRKLFALLDKGKNLLDQDFVLNHGDIHFPNLILSPNSPFKIAFLDWEKARYSNEAADLAFFWVENAPYPAFRQKLVQKFQEGLKDKSRFWILFKIMTLGWLVKEIGELQSSDNNDILNQHIQDFEKILGEFNA